MNNKYTVGDLFAGAGGLSKAFQQAGAKVVWANDIDKNACQLYKENFNDVCLVEGDIKNIEVEEIPKIDILVGGFPCQSFSVMGSNNKFNDKGENLFLEILRILKAKKPKAFLLENTKGLMSHDNGRTFKLIIESLHNGGYFIKSKVLNSIEHGNIPHNRERMYIVGFRSEEEYNLFEFPEKIELTLKVNEIFDISEEKEEKYYCNNLKDYERYYSKFQELITKNDKMYELNTIYKNNERIQVLNEYNYCPTLLRASCPLINDGFGIRKLIPSEWFEFQGFSDFKMLSLIDERKLHNIASICSSVTVVKRIAENIIGAIDKKENFEEENERIIDNKVVFRCCKNKLYEFLKDDESSIGTISSDIRTVNISNVNNSNQRIENVKNKKEKNEKNESEFYNEINAGTLINKLSEIKSGREQANIFHDHIYIIVKFIFEGYLKRPKKEVNINEDRKRIDIMFDNLAEKGFFYELRNLHNIFCPKIIIECKNYSSNISNPEIDQLIGRFNNHIGKFGILICRSIKDKENLINRCKDALYGGQGHILVLSDEDIKKLIIFRQDSNIEEIDNFLRDKLDDLIL